MHQIVFSLINKIGKTLLNWLSPKSDFAIEIKVLFNSHYKLFKWVVEFPKNKKEIKNNVN